VVPFPKDQLTCEVSALIHEQLQDRDWCSLKPGEPVFRGFDGTVTNWEGDEEVFPVFINEVAYCCPPPLGNNAKLAFFPNKKECIRVPAFCAK
jgi:hypothetical protein